MKTRTWIILLVILIAIPVGWYLISPLFINKTVHEDFPSVQTTEIMEDNDMMEEKTEMSDEMASDKAMSGDQMAEDAMMKENEPMDESTGTMEGEEMKEGMQDMDDAMPKAETTLLFMGEFYNLAHEGMGTATIYQLADGSRILRFENFEVLNGPDLHVYLTSLDPVPNTVGVELAGSVDLGQLKGNIGDQNYEIPADLDLSLFKSVVIWCQPFRVPFNAAPLHLTP